MLTFLLVIQAIVAVLLVGVILMQQSEGGGLGMGGSPTGLMSARGAADFLTRATTVLASLFIGLSILHAVLATRVNSGAAIDTSLAKKAAPAAPASTAPAVPLANDPSAVPVPVPLGNAVPGPAPAAVPLAASPTAAPKAKPRVERVQARRAAPEAAAPPPVVATTPAAPAGVNGN